MKSNRSSFARGRLVQSGALIAGLSCAAVSASAQVSINLTQDATVKAAGNYTYYARGDANAAAISPFTTKFYPGGALHGFTGNTTTDGGLIDNGSNAASIAFSSGDLTNTTTNLDVAGWINVEQLTSGTASGNPHTGSVDIVFDLGASYTITSVIVTYTDVSGFRWATAANAQKVFTSASAPTTDAGLSLLATGSITSNTTNGTMSFAGTAIDARYVVFRPDFSVSPNPGNGSTGGYINEVTIMGYASAVPEPSAFALFAGFAGLACASLRRSPRRA